MPSPQQGQPNLMNSALTLFRRVPVHAHHKEKMMTFDPSDLTAADIEELWRPNPDARGPVTITVGIALDDLPLCGFCPFARWYVRDDVPHAFCKEFRDLVYPSKGSGVTMCDAYAIASGRVKDLAPEA